MYINNLLPTIIITALLSEMGHTMKMSVIEMIALYIFFLIVMISFNLFIKEMKEGCKTY